MEAEWPKPAGARCLHGLDDRGAEFADIDAETLEVGSSRSVTAAPPSSSGHGALDAMGHNSCSMAGSGPAYLIPVVPRRPNL